MKKTDWNQLCDTVVNCLGATPKSAVEIAAELGVKETAVKTALALLGSEKVPVIVGGRAVVKYTLTAGTGSVMLKVKALLEAVGPRTLEGLVQGTGLPEYTVKCALARLGATKTTTVVYALP